MLKGKNAIITGASRGIGREIALTLAENGANIVINYRNYNNEIEALVKDIEAKGVKIVTVKCDVSNFEEVENLISEAKEKLGSIDILVNNAGITKDGLLLRMKEEDFDSVINVSYEKKNRPSKKDKLIEKINAYKTKEERAACFYSFFTSKKASKADFAQELAINLETKYINRAEDLKKVLPDYLISAIIYVTKG